MRDLTRLRRSRDDRKIAGVSGGLGRHFDLDPTIFRVAFVVLALFGGAGLLLYGICWLLVPEDGAARARLDIEPSARSVVLITFAAISAVLVLADSSGIFDFPWLLVLVGVVVMVVMMGRKDRQPGAVSLTKDGDPVDPAAPTWQPPLMTGQTGWVGQPGWVPPPPAPRPYRGPGLFLATVALIAVALGITWLLDLSGTDVPGGAYPALALAICGGMLVLGAWFGRAGGVLFLAMLAGIGLGIANLADHGIGGTTEHTPQFAASVRSTYDIGIGELRLDLSEVSDVEALDGRRVTLTGDLASIEVIVPAGVDVIATGDISGGGSVEIFGDTEDGDSPNLTGELEGGLAVPTLTIDAGLDFGDIIVRTP